MTLPLEGVHLGNLLVERTTVQLHAEEAGFEASVLLLQAGRAAILCLVVALDAIVCLVKGAHQIGSRIG